TPARGATSAALGKVVRIWIMRDHPITTSRGWVMGTTSIKTASRHLKMTKYKLSAIALALMTSVPALAASQADSKGFVEDSSADLFLRNAYMNRDYYDGRHDSTEWGQGVILNFNSGFTQGVVGFGVDAFGQYALRLDSGRGRAGNGGIDFCMVDNTGAVESYAAHGGAAPKARFSKTVLSYGDQRPSLPVLSHDNSRLLPETFTGTMLTSNEI